MMKLLPPETEKPGATLSMMPGSCRFALASSAAILFIYFNSRAMAQGLTRQPPAYAGRIQANTPI
jgi:hypothetical protein